MLVTRSLLKQCKLVNLYSTACLSFAEQVKVLEGLYQKRGTVPASSMLANVSHW